MGKELSEQDIRKRLRIKYPPPVWIFLEELRRYNGFSRGSMRSADAFAINLYPSQGCSVEGFEIKMQRGDWLSELKNPDKADEFKQFCDRWWLVVGSRDLVKLEELPPGWGLMVPHNVGLSIKRGAPMLKPNPWDMALFTSILKVVRENREDKEYIDRIKEEQYAAGRSYVSQEYTLMRDRLFALERTMKRFQESSGINISGWNSKELGKAVRIVMNTNSLQEYYQDMLIKIEHSTYQLEEKENSLLEIRKVLKSRGIVFRRKRPVSQECTS